MTDEECSYGIAGRKWAYDNVTERCDDVDYVDECGIDTAIHYEFCGTKREMRKHKKEHETRHSAWCEKFDSKWDSKKHEFIDGLNDEYENFKDGVGQRSLRNYHRAFVALPKKWCVSGRNIG
jgi:hypothetical protein